MIQVHTEGRPGYKARDRKDNFFKPGKVTAIILEDVCRTTDHPQIFKCLYNEEEAHTSKSKAWSEKSSLNGYGQRVFTKIRMWVVLREAGKDMSLCL